jgi:hypothetical protein
LTEIQANINVLEIKMCVMTCYIKPCVLIMIMTTHRKMNMLELVMIIYLVYCMSMIVRVHINKMWPTINVPSGRRLTYNFIQL